MESVDALRDELRGIGSDLLVCNGKPEDVIAGMWLTSSLTLLHTSVAYQHKYLGMQFNLGHLGRHLTALTVGEISYRGTWLNTSFEL